MNQNVFVCEDDAAQRALLEKVILNYIALKDYDMKLALSARNPNDVLAHLETNPQQGGIYFLDIDLNHKINGIVLAQTIRESDLTGWIIFVTTHAELSYLTFRHRVEAMDYIIKGNRDELIKSIQECIDIAYERHRNEAIEPEYFRVKTSMGIQKIPLAEILYFETHHVPHKIILHTRNKRIEFRGTLKEVAAMNPAFFPCHKAYVVNTKNVIRVNRIGATGDAELVSGSVVPVSKSRVAELADILKL